MSAIWELLRKKHDGDLYVEECLMGPSGSPRLDAWVLKRTWSPLTTVGYEVKLSRSDFLRDDKWQTYLDACHGFSFVCPHGMIQPEELPSEVGLIWLSQTGRRLFTKRKAQRRDIEPPPELLVHVLMCRSVIVANMWEANAKRTGKDPGRERRVELWREWLKDREQCRGLGAEVAGKIREIWMETSRENARLKSLHETYEFVRKRMTELGFDPEKSLGERHRERRISEALALIPDRLLADVRGASSKLGELADKLEEWKTKNTETTE